MLAPLNLAVSFSDSKVSETEFTLQLTAQHKKDQFQPRDVSAELHRDSDGHDQVEEGDAVQLDVPPVHHAH